MDTRNDVLDDVSKAVQECSDPRSKQGAIRVYITFVCNRKDWREALGEVCKSSAEQSRPDPRFPGFQVSKRSACESVKRSVERQYRGMDDKQRMEVESDALRWKKADEQYRIADAWVRLRKFEELEESGLPASGPDFADRAEGLNSDVSAITLWLKEERLLGAGPQSEEAGTPRTDPQAEAEATKEELVRREEELVRREEELARERKRQLDRELFSRLVAREEQRATRAFGILKEREREAAGQAVVRHGPELMDTSRLIVKKGFNVDRYKVSFDGESIPWTNEEKTWPQSPAAYLKVFQLAGKGEIETANLRREIPGSSLKHVRTKQVRPRLKPIGYTIKADPGRNGKDRIVKISTVSETGTEKVEEKK